MRAYQESHPWITFKATDINDLGPMTWMLLGEARSKCEHLAGAPLQPDVAQRLYDVCLIKGARATTAIEGNTLTEDQVAGILAGTFRAPPSRAYQEREVRNVIEALQEIDVQAMRGESPVITKELICDFNRQLLDGTEHPSHVVPGKVRDYSVGVWAYRGAPAEDCDYLLEQLAEWLEGDVFKSDDPETRFALAVACAVYSHLYLAWIHPFGDGNGRTARLLEFLILARSGMIPLAAAHLLSNHYNLTRDRYYGELATASQARKTVGFLTYATQGLVDGLRDQIEQVRQHQMDVTWVNYVHQVMNRHPLSPARDRQHALVLAMPSDRDVPKNELPMLTPELAALYATKGPRTLSRDLNRLQRSGLVHRHQDGWTTNQFIMKAFLPPVAQGSP